MSPFIHPRALPAGAWDSHVHVIDEVSPDSLSRSLRDLLGQETFPFSPDHPYRPKRANLDDLLDFELSNGIDRVCIVAVSVYGTDNSSLIDALKRLGSKGRGVACIDPESITDEELRAMHDVGVRGVRLNIKTQSQQPEAPKFAELLRQYAERVRALGWVLQLYVSLEQIALIADVIPTLGIKVVFDHLGSPAEAIPSRKQRGYTELLQLLTKKKAWIKISGTYRFARLPDLEKFAREILYLAPTQVVWASDWPHTGGVESNPGGDRNEVQEYRKVSTPDFIGKCLMWCDYDQDLIQKVWVDNPGKLWQYEQ